METTTVHETLFDSGYNPRPQEERRTQGGTPTTNVVGSTHIGSNDGIFPDILKLHVPEGSVIADITYGRGVFWKNVHPDKYRVLATDLKLGTDWKELPYSDNSVDAVVFDPPYMEGFYRQNRDSMAGSGTHSEFQKAYSHREPSSSFADRKYHDAVLEAYLSALPEVKRILRASGQFIVKCQDEVSANRQKLTHVELIWAFEHHGFYCKDLFVVVRPNAPVISRLKRQEHARKSHSYFLIFVRQDHRKSLSYSNFGDWLRTPERDD